MKIIIKFVILVTVVFLLMASLMYVFFNSEIEANLARAQINLKNMKDMMFPIIITTSVLGIVVTSVFTAIMVLYSSHKIAGPLYNFQHVIDSIAGRTFPTQVRIRKDDQLSEFAISLEQMIGVLNEDFMHLKKTAAELKRESAKSGKPHLRHLVKDLQDILNHYSTRAGDPG